MNSVPAKQPSSATAINMETGHRLLLIVVVNGHFSIVLPKTVGGHHWT